MGLMNRAKGRNSTSILHVPLSLLTRLYMANRSYNVMKVFSFSSRVRVRVRVGVF